MISRLIFPSAVLIVVPGVCLTHLTSCKKDCFDPELKALHENDGCTTDCPGVKGCDGNTYCNECEANRMGIAVVP